MNVTSVCLEMLPCRYLLLSFCCYLILSLSFLASPEHSCSTITLVGAKKRKRNASSDHSDGELSPASPAALEDDLITVQTHTWSHK